VNTNKQCSECGTPFLCGCDSAGSCWCADYPAVMPADYSRDCRCPDCLSKAIARRIEDRLAALDHAAALQLAASQPPSPRLIEHIDYTMEGERFVFTGWFLLKQGTCCGNGCRNCTYPD